MPLPVPFQLLEINVISAQDLAPANRAMQTYAVAWVHPDRKLSTRVDPHGHTEPTWNDKFVFRVDDAFLNSDTSAVMVEIYALRCFRDVRVGSVRVLVGNLIPTTTKPTRHPTMRFVALQVRRPSGRPQGILNIGVTVLDSSMRSVPLYTQLSSSALGYRDLMGEESHDPNHNHNNNKPQLRRSRSERSMNEEMTMRPKPPPSILGSDLGPPAKATATTGSVWSESELGPAPSLAGGDFQGDEVGSSVLEDWSMDDQSVEGLRSKLERWRTELPPIYDRGGMSSFRSQVVGGPAKKHTGGEVKAGGGRGLFRCFGKAYGCECSIFCGTPAPRTTRKKKKI